MSVEAAIEGFMKEYPKDRVQMFNNKGFMPDDYEIIHEGHDGTVRYCHYWDYMEVLDTEPEVYNKIFDKYGY